MRNSWYGYTLLSIVILASVALSSCRPEPVGPDDARVIVLQPTADSVVSSPDVSIRTFVEYFKLVDKNGQPNQAGEVHLVFYLDVTPPTLKGTPALTQEGTYIISAEKTYTWSDVPPGQHSFWVQLVNNDNTSLEPPAAVRVPVTVVK